MFGLCPNKTNLTCSDMEDCVQERLRKSKVPCCKAIVASALAFCDGKEENLNVITAADLDGHSNARAAARALRRPSEECIIQDTPLAHEIEPHFHVEGEYDVQQS